MEDMNDVKVMLSEFDTELKEMRNALRIKAKVIMKDAFEKFFDKYDFVEGVIWQQYTPYFNDGDPCTFSINDPEFCFFGQEWEDYNDLYGSGAMKEPGRYTKQKAEDGESWAIAEVKQYADNLDKFGQSGLDEFDDDFKAIRTFVTSLDTHMEDMFGDHVTVTVKRDGITTEEYDHD